MYIPQQWERVDTNLIHTYNNENTNKTNTNDATHQTIRKYTGKQIAITAESNNYKRKNKI